MSEIFKEDINIDGILIAPKNEELGKCVPFSIISPIFILQQVLAPWWYGKKIDLTLSQVIRTIIYFASRYRYFIEKLVLTDGARSTV